MTREVTKKELIDLLKKSNVIGYSNLNKRELLKVNKDIEKIRNTKFDFQIQIIQIIKSRNLRLIEENKYLVYSIFTKDNKRFLLKQDNGNFKPHILYYRKDKQNEK